MKKLLLTALLGCLLKNALAQLTGNQSPASNPTTADSAVLQTDQFNKQTQNGRKWLAGGLAIAVLGGSLYLLTKSNDYVYEKKFKTVNDGGAWRQMDKSEHAYLSYTTTRLLHGLGNWAGFSPQQSVILASTGSLAYLTTKEYLDGHFAIPGTGWSWMDMGANLLGTTLFASQQLVWQEQKIQFKFSALPKTYEPELNARANILFGSSKPERVLKDYNAQTYWLSFNLKAFSQSQNLPPWLNLAVGYGANNLFGPQENIGYANGKVAFDRTDLKRYRQWYISPDIDLTKIKTNSRLVKTLFFALNAVKVPLPTLEFSDQKVKGHWLHF
ncbi:DUF2279 domain-containing protein [Adhaeribacter aerolatus]|uniref:DUF2279 domain-containing protein n=1 Tax=Adhaeribacter aerolatus TaxID=670289 RepID=A0A512AZ72_9BACT|nr:DUF2279 domain-containing protein [Adhaeribacter aerolatus]GEO05000.1 DUF2279 domain-containing protein [Adhaeribacter aerolatus]